MLLLAARIFVRQVERGDELFESRQGMRHRTLGWCAGFAMLEQVRAADVNSAFTTRFFAQSRVLKTSSPHLGAIRSQCSAYLRPDGLRSRAMN